MTLIAALCPEHPILVSDILIGQSTGTGPLSNFRPYPVPTNLDPNELVRQQTPNPDVIIAGMTQKTIIAGGRAAVTFAGNAQCAEIVAKKIAHLGSDVNLKSVQEILHDYRTADFSAIAMVTFDGGVDITSINTKFGRTKQFGQVFASGTGDEAFLQLIASLDGNLALPRGGAVTRAIVSTLSIFGSMLGQQMRTGSGLAQAYGGIYELTTFYDGLIRKVGDVLYLYFEVTKVEPIKLRLQPMLLKVSYMGDLLVIRRTTLCHPDDARCREESTASTTVLSPATRTIEKREEVELRANIPRLELDSAYTVTYVFVPQARPEHQIVTLVHSRGRSGEPCLHVESDDDRVVFAEGFVRRLGDAAARAIESV